MENHWTVFPYSQNYKPLSLTQPLQNTYILSCLLYARYSTADKNRILNMQMELGWWLRIKLTGPKTEPQGPSGGTVAGFIVVESRHLRPRFSRRRGREALCLLWCFGVIFHCYCFFLVWRIKCAFFIISFFFL